MSALFSIGHSRHPLERFLALLRQHRVQVVADVRSQPYSRHAPQYNRKALERALLDGGLRYLFLGVELGGRPEGDEFYDLDGHVLYGKVAASAPFHAGIRHLQRGEKRFRVAILCSEEEPTSCHRRLLIGRVLAVRGVELRHIRGDGRLEAEADLERAPSRQVPLFREPEEEAWRSTRSVSRRGAPASSSQR